MLKHLAAIDSSLAFDDYFYSRGLDIVDLNFGGQTGAYAGSNREDFIIDFFAFLQKDSNNILSNRSAWATKELVLDGTKYGTVQQAARDTMALLFSMEEDSKTSVMERVSNISDALHWLTFSSDVSIRDLFDDVLGDWHTLSDKKKLKYMYNHRLSQNLDIYLRLINMKKENKNLYKRHIDPQRHLKSL